MKNQPTPWKFTETSRDVHQRHSEKVLFVEHHFIIRDANGYVVVSTSDDTSIGNFKERFDQVRANFMKIVNSVNRSDIDAHNL